MLQDIVKKLMIEPKGILAADESTTSANKRLLDLGVEATPSNRRHYRELLLTTPNLNEYISGVILYEETLKDATSTGVPFVRLLSDAGIVIGIKVDLGTVPLFDNSGDFKTNGLDGLEARLREYKDLGAEFTKWRAMFVISEQTPSLEAIQQNATDLAMYAKIVQNAGMVPIVEPEIMMTGSHSIEKCAEITAAVLQAVFSALDKHAVDLSAIILKPNMVLPGVDHEEATPAEVAEWTLKTLVENVPPTVGGVAFLSGGQSSDMAMANLNVINQHSGLPWRVTFSFSRALMMPALQLWRGQDDLWSVAQNAFASEAKRASLASIGKL